MTIAVIGRGLIGSAAARHLAKGGEDVVLIGPSEPAEKRHHPGVFASHYDEGRITRALDPVPFWSRVSQASIPRYGEIEAESGISFFSEVGALIAGDVSTAPMRAVEAERTGSAVACDVLDDAVLAERFPYFDFPVGTVGYHEARGAGYISPRRLVAAQTAAAKRAGARVVEAVATGVSETGAGVRVETDRGPVEAERVLVAAGGFTNMVLREPLPITVYARTVALFEIDEAEAARLSGQPSMIYLGPGGEDPYLLPPIRYPDGRVYLKLGGDPEDRALADAEETRARFRSGGSAEVADYLTEAVKRRMPGLAIRRLKTDACVTTFTDAYRPIIAPVGDRIAVAAAGNGRGAKCSDELGRLAALCVTGTDVSAELA
jgi:sarcosine oxidase